MFPIILTILGLVSLSVDATAEPIGTTFTYQGRLAENGEATTGWYAMRFTLWDMATRGIQLGQPQIESHVSVVNGLFTVMLDFGVDPIGRSYIKGDALWLEIGVDHDRGTNFIILSPRQAITPTPYAIYAIYATDAGLAKNATTAASVPATGISGTLPDTRLSTNVVLLNSNPAFNGSVTSQGNIGKQSDRQTVINPMAGVFRKFELPLVFTREDLTSDPAS